MKVYLVGRPCILHDELYAFMKDQHREYTRDLSDAQTLIEVAGRLCYDSFANPRPGGIEAYIKNILESGHGSVLEHATFNFLITGVSRSLTHELVRHRAGWAYSQRSQRYVDEGECDMILPDAIADDKDSRGMFFDAAANMRYAYKKLYARLMELEAARNPTASKTELRKAARGAARSVLPSAAETLLMATANCRALRHFFELRGSRHADAEIRQLAILMFFAVKPLAPQVFGDYRVRNGGIDGEYRKV